MTQALGLIEVVGYPTVIEAADAALKASNVRLSEITKVDGGIMTVQLFGDVGAITAAVEAGKVAAERVGSVRSAHVIPRVDESLIGTVIKTKSVAKSTVSNEDSVKTVEADIKRVGSVRSAHVIPRVDESLIGTVIKTKSVAKSTVSNEDSVKTVEADIKEPLQQETKEPLVISKSDTTETHGVETNEAVENLEHLSKKSNTELRQLIVELGINISNKKLREAKKAELIRMITEAKK